MTLQNEMFVSDLGYQVGPDSAVLISTIKFQNLSLMDFWSLPVSGFICISTICTYLQFPHETTFKTIFLFLIMSNHKIT